MISNVLSNASKYSPVGSEVIFQARKEDAHVLITVRDSVIGISDEDRDHIFEPFYRVNNAETNKESGTGLGLFISKSIIEMHQGTIRIESVLDEGTTVTVSIPWSESSS